MYPGEVSVEDRIPEAVREALRKKGHKLKVTGGWSLGSTAAIAVDPDTGVLSAGADPTSRCVRGRLVNTANTRITFAATRSW